MKYHILLGSTTRNFGTDGQQTPLSSNGNLTQTQDTVTQPSSDNSQGNVEEEKKAEEEPEEQKVIEPIE